MRDWAAPAVSAAKEVGDAALIAAAAVMPAFADAMTGPAETARSRRAQAAALVDELPDDELSLRPDAAGWLAIAEVYLDLYAEADAHASRALAARSRERAGGSLAPPLSRPAQGLVRARQAGRGCRAPGRCHRGRRVCSGRRRRLPGTCSTGPSSHSPPAIWTSRSPPQRRASNSRATSTKVSSQPGPRRGSPASCSRPGNQTEPSSCSSAVPVVRS